MRPAAVCLRTATNMPASHCMPAGGSNDKQVYMRATSFGATPHYITCPMHIESIKLINGSASGMLSAGQQRAGCAVLCIFATSIGSNDR